MLRQGNGCQRRRSEVPMFGYIGCVKEKLSEEEQKRYQSIYCGLCRNLKERYGQVERLCLSYDMLF